MIINKKKKRFTRKFVNIFNQCLPKKKKWCLLPTHKSELSAYRTFPTGHIAVKCQKCEHQYVFYFLTGKKDIYFF